MPLPLFDWRPDCVAARILALELAADIAERRYQRTRSHRARIAMEAARTAALAAQAKRA